MLLMMMEPVDLVTTYVLVAGPALAYVPSAPLKYAETV